MSFSISVTVDTAELERIAGQLDTKSSEVIRTLGFKAEGYAKTYAPVDTGALRDSIHTIDMQPAWVRVQPEVYYAIYQELGTYKMAAHPFLTPAIEQISGEFLSPETWQPLFT